MDNDALVLVHARALPTSILGNVADDRQQRREAIRSSKALKELDRVHP
jgi:hypothetical protein